MPVISIWLCDKVCINVQIRSAAINGNLGLVTMTKFTVLARTSSYSLPPALLL